MAVVYIARDGTIHRAGAGEVSTGSAAKVGNNNSSSFRLGVQYLIVIVGILLVAESYLSPQASNPLTDDRIPAAEVRPEKHWSRLKGDTFLVRDMMSGIAASSSNVDNAEIVRLAAAEEVDWSERTMLEAVKVTRCATTQDAVTAYFCGARVASNERHGGGGGGGGGEYYEEYMYRPNEGTEGLSFHLACRHEQGERNGGVHKRSVYRIDVSPANDELVFGHVLNVVAQPDGTFFWLQSFIGEYSLSTWLGRKDPQTQSGLRGHLTLSEVLAKLDQIKLLMEVKGWDEEANFIYKDLFDADKSQVANEWDLSHRLSFFLWDEACEYPVPDGYGGIDVNKDDSGLSADDEEDECVSEDTKAFSNLLLNLLRGKHDDDEMYQYGDDEHAYEYEDDYSYAEEEDYMYDEEHDDYYTSEEYEEYDHVTAMA